MSEARQAIVVDVEPEGDGSIALIAEPVGLRHRISREDLVERDELVALAVQARRASPGASYYLGDGDRDAATLRSELVWSTLRLWDLEYVFRPLLGSCEQRSLVLHPGRSRLAFASLRGGLREGIRTGVLAEDALHRVCGLAYWSPLGLEQALVRATRQSIPVVDPRRTTLLVAPPPSSLLEALAAAPRGRWARLLGAARSDLLSRETTATFERELLDRAARLGVTVIHPARQIDVIEHFGAALPGSTLLLIAHQDVEGIHLADGPLPLRALRVAFADWAAAGGLAHETVDLGICLAEEEDNLAECFQALGTPIVMTRGMTSFYGRDVVAALLLMRRLDQCGPGPLPELADEIWLDLQRHLRRDPTG